VIVLQASFAYNNCYCAEIKPAENLPSSNPVKQIKKRIISNQNPSFNQLTPKSCHEKRDQEPCDALPWLAKVLGNQMQLSILQIFQLN